MAKMFTILFAVEDDISAGQMVDDLNEAVNDHGLIGGNFLIVGEEQGDEKFWRNWGEQVRTEREARAKVDG